MHYFNPNTQKIFLLRNHNPLFYQKGKWSIKNHFKWLTNKVLSGFYFLKAIVLVLAFLEFFIL